MIKTAPHGTLSPVVYKKKNKIKDWFVRTQIYWQELVERKKIRSDLFSTLYLL